MVKVCMIMAIGPKNIIGKGKELAWHSKNDFYHFKKQTLNYPCIFGETTFYNLPKYPLKQRLNLVVDINVTGTFVRTTPESGSWIETNSIEKAINFGKHYNKIFICGGKSIYKYCLEKNLIDELYLTKITDPSGQLEADVITHPEDYVYFPIDLDEYTKDWKKEEIKYDFDLVYEDLWCDFIKFTR